MTYVLLDNSLDRGGLRLLFDEPAEVIVAHEPAEVGPALARIEKALGAGQHAAGFFAYELGLLLEPRLAHRLPRKRDVPLLWFVIVNRPRRLSDADCLRFLKSRAGAHSAPRTISVSLDEKAYLSRFDIVKDMIASGDIYQLNLTFKARFEIEGPPEAHYLDLRKKQRVAYGAVVATDTFTILSSSPELFVRITDGVIETRPMKGTAARAMSIAADAEAKRILASDVKQRAENLMIVDLMRNDIGRISEIGSVEVTDLFSVETYRTLHQLTSGVRAQLEPGIGLSDWLPAIFSPGSVTGAPKVRAMELISELETEPRGVYCGAIGWLAPNGDACFNVAIRTATIWPGGKAEMGIGSGVVWDSVGTSEYAECLLKMKFLTEPAIPLELFETMLWDGGAGIYLEQRHVDRLKSSADYFGLPLDTKKLARIFAGFAKRYGATRQRVRLVLGEEGQLSLTATPLAATDPQHRLRYVVSDQRVDPTDPFLYHKTTRRALYEGEHARAMEVFGADEVIFLNSRGEIAEGSRTTVFIERDGVLLTPTLASGLLPGTLRAELLEAGRAQEAVLTPDDLERGRVFLGNSVRGLMRADPIDRSELTRRAG
ncbi:MAG: aminodeoxychorismate synthase component I [Hyphomicrobiaceae bacterium]